MVAYRMVAIVEPYLVRQLTLNGRNIDKSWSKRAFLASLRREGLRPVVEVSDVDYLDVVTSSSAS